MAATSSFLYISFLREMSLSGVNQNHCQENQILCHCNLSIKAVFSWSLKVYVMSQFFSNGIFLFLDTLGDTWKWAWNKGNVKKNPSYYICNRQIPKSIQWLLVINELKFYKELNFFPKQEWKSVYLTRHDFVCIKCMIAT